MASALFLAPVDAAILARVRALLLARTFEVDGAGTRQPLTIYPGVAAQRAPLPYVIVGHNPRSRAFNTMGPPDAPKYGATVTVPIRIVTQAPTTQAQAYAMLEPIHAGLNGQELAVAGIPGLPIVTGDDTVVLTDTINGVPTCELLTEYDVTVHQAP